MYYEFVFPSHIFEEYVLAMNAIIFLFEKVLPIAISVT